ncbi:MAG: zinc metallopeptidase [Elusimicrobia bacterium]|nr:zinc metallopeptidase [Elusimicrobiota bacterium]
MFLFDWTFLILIPALIFSLIAQGLVNRTWKKTSKIPSDSGITASDFADIVASKEGLFIKVVPVTGVLTDHYNPINKTLALSEEVFHSESIGALSICAHELGHAIQHKTGYIPLKVRNSIVPVVNFGSSAALPLFFVGFIFAWKTLMDIGIIFFAGALLFHLVTLPVELDASKRALLILKNYIPEEKVSLARSMLFAAALTYIAAIAVALSQLIRLLILREARE